MNFYPSMLRRVADMCEALDRIDGDHVPETDGVRLGMGNGIPVLDEEGDVYGHLGDPVGGAWCFTPGEENPYRKPAGP